MNGRHRHKGRAGPSKKANDVLRIYRLARPLAGLVATRTQRTRLLYFTGDPTNGQPSWMNRENVADYKAGVKLNT